MNPYLQVAVGGAAGSVARYAFYRLTPGQGFAVATFAINVIGSLLMGFLASVLIHRGGQQFAPLVLTGVLGGFTTFSAFSLDALTLWERGNISGAMMYVIGSVLLSLIAVTVGLTLGRGLFA